MNLPHETSYQHLVGSVGTINPDFIIQPPATPAALIRTMTNPRTTSAGIEDVKSIGPGSGFGPLTLQG